MISGEVKTRLDDVVGPEDYERDEEAAARTLEHYRHNLGRMVDIARSVGARVLFVVPASNLRDCEPFKSVVEEGLAPEAKARIEAGLAEARAQLEAQDFEGALATTEEALALDPRHAHLCFLRGARPRRPGSIRRGGRDVPARPGRRTSAPCARCPRCCPSCARWRASAMPR